MPRVLRLETLRHFGQLVRIRLLKALSGSAFRANGHKEGFARANDRRQERLKKNVFLTTEEIAYLFQTLRLHSNDANQPLTTTNKNNNQQQQQQQQQQTTLACKPGQMQINISILPAAFPRRPICPGQWVRAAAQTRC